MKTTRMKRRVTKHKKNDEQISVTMYQNEENKSNELDETEKQFMKINREVKKNNSVWSSVYAWLTKKVCAKSSQQD